MNKTRAQLQKEESKIMDQWFDEWHAKREKGDNSYPNWDYEEKINEMRREWRQSLEVGDRVHICHYSDITPATIIKKTKTSLTVRHDKAHLDGWKPEMIPGGFSVVCLNDSDQIGHWIIEEDSEGSIEVFRWSKRYNRYKNTSDEFCEPEWMKYYDYNF